MNADALTQLVTCELKRLWRIPAFSIPTLVLPSLFFLLFGVPHADQLIDGMPAGQYLLISYGTFAVMSVGMFAFGASLASEREHGWSNLIRIASVPPALYLGSKLIVATLFAAATIVVLLLFAALNTMGSVNAEVVRVLMICVLPGVVTFSALGMVIGYLCAAHSAAAVANIVFIPLAFASGLFVPLQALPTVLQHLAPFLPSFHLAMIGWSQLAGRQDEVSLAIVMMIGYTTAFLLLALWAYQREEAREYE